MAVIFIECGSALVSRFNTGIQRVVRNIVRESGDVAITLGHQCVNVSFVDDDFYVLQEESSVKLQYFTNRIYNWFCMLAVKIDMILGKSSLRGFYSNPRRALRFIYRWIYYKSLNFNERTSMKAFLDNETEKRQQLMPISKDPPVLLLLDATWDERIWVAVDRFRDSGGHVYAVLYDLIPFSHPETVQEHTRKAHTSWWYEAPLHIDSVICISQSVRNQFLQWQVEHNLARQILPEHVSYFYLGSELPVNKSQIGNSVLNILDTSQYFFLVVGSIEPRKNHGVVLDAFDILWQEGLPVDLIIVGGHGWKSEDLIERIKTHPLLNKRLFLLREVTDAELGLLYEKTVALIFASIAEGFGLPIVEALQRGSEVICSDIPVFHEIAGENAIYFDPFNPLFLAQVISEKSVFTEGFSNSSKTITNTKVNWITWRESTEQLLSRVLLCEADSRGDKL